MLATGGMLTSALQARVRLIPSRYDFGVMHEADGRKEGRVLLVNDSAVPTLIRQVRPSCGCTDADYYKDIIMPGDTAWVSFVYNPIGRPGPFEKTIKVITGESKDVNVITISGSVIGTDETLSRLYPVNAGSMRLTEDTITLMEVKAGRSRHAFINVYNAADDTITPHILQNVKGIEASFTPTHLAPGQLGTLGIYLDTRHEARRGGVDYTLMLSASSGNVADTVPITVRAIITDPIKTLIPKKANHSHQNGASRKRSSI